MTTWREELSWAAGFFDGEGHVGFSRKARRLDLRLSMTQTDRAVLDRFQRATGLGRVGGPFLRSYRNPNENDIYAYQIARFEHVQAIVAMLWAFLSPVKRGQAKQALIAMRARSTHSKTCSRGHERTRENTYLAKNGQHWCRICVLDRQKRYRDQQRITPA